MSTIAAGIACLFLVAPAIMVVFCYAPRYLVLCEIGRLLHIRNPKVKQTPFGAWLMLTYYRAKLKKRGFRSQTYALYVCALILSGVVAGLVTIAAFFHLQTNVVFRWGLNAAYIALCIVNIICFHQLRFRHKS